MSTGACSIRVIREGISRPKAIFKNYLYQILVPVRDLGCGVIIPTNILAFCMDLNQRKTTILQELLDTLSLYSEHVHRELQRLCKYGTMMFSQELCKDRIRSFLMTDMTNDLSAHKIPDLFFYIKVQALG